MIETRAFATQSPTSPLAPFSISRREPGEHDVLIEILYCGVCHSDVHQARDEWGGSRFPMVPGHEIVGRVTRAGNGVTRWKTGDLVGVGCFVDSCRVCAQCRAGVEQYCDGHTAFTYNSTEMDEKTPTFGGYSTHITVDENYVLRVPASIPLERAAPLLCAGITMYSPLRHWKIGKGHRVGVVGLGGLGHMAVKLAAALGAEVTLLSTSPKKKADAIALGAHEFLLSRDENAMKAARGRFDFVLDTASAAHDLEPELQLLRLDGTLILVGVPEVPAKLPAMGLIGRRRSIAGSLIGGIRETQEMLDFCGEKGLGADVEVIPMQGINEAYERMLKSDVRYRFSIDMATLR